MKIIRFIFAFICIVVGAAVAFAQTNAAEGSLLANPVYQKNCAKCHGKTAEGRHFGGPALISAKIGGASNDELLSIITNGKGRMPKYGAKLAAEEIGTLVEQIRALNKQQK